MYYIQLAFHCNKLLLKQTTSKQLASSTKSLPGATATVLLTRLSDRPSTWHIANVPTSHQCESDNSSVINSPLSNRFLTNLFSNHLPRHVIAQLLRLRP